MFYVRIIRRLWGRMTDLQKNSVKGVDLVGFYGEVFKEFECLFF